MRLYLVQHGEAVQAAVDPERPLSGRGHEEVRRIADLLAQSGVRAGLVRHSGKLRARQTAELLAAGVAPGASPEARAGLNPNDPVEEVVGRAGSWTEDRMLVGHLPFMERLAAALVTGRADDAVVAFRPGSVLCLERQDGGRWSVAWMLRPELLEEG